MDFPDALVLQLNKNVSEIRVDVADIKSDLCKVSERIERLCEYERRVNTLWADRQFTRRLVAICVAAAGALGVIVAKLGDIINFLNRYQFP